MAKADLKKVFLEAAAIAKELPKNLQEAGFHRALEALLASAGQAERLQTHVARKGMQNPAKQSPSSDSRIALLLDAINRTKYEDIGVTARVADRALKVLDLAHKDFDVDGLTATEISTILSKKFRLPVKANSVTKALERETGTVDVRVGPDGSRMFLIMAGGEGYLKSLREARSKKATVRNLPAKKERARARPVPSDRTAAPEKRKGDAGGGASVGGKSRSRLGPKAVVELLIGGGFFRSARTISAVQSELRHGKGRAFTVQELSPALVRLVRDERLARERNETGHYEYTEG